MATSLHYETTDISESEVLTWPFLHNIKTKIKVRKSHKISSLKQSEIIWKKLLSTEKMVYELKNDEKSLNFSKPQTSIKNTNVGNF